MKHRFISLVEIKGRSLNGNFIETKEHIGINADRITHVIPVFSEDRCIIFVDGDGDGRTVDIGYDSLMDLLNE